MNPEFFSLVDVLAERGIKCEFYTNGTLLAAAGAAGHLVATQYQRRQHFL